ncbi:sodium:solute symporter [Shewanella sp. OMA3-2]|uniref:sodium:solute symporter n=1 Tax=Shewanella sp. OMA3-2 TaxID=2908650 RepID=UPI001F42C0A6|nr:sodium:solute symporter [Shewanella sp. OMA3-2]UJF22918.1 sodium:solute symporter [Shewanella sp. OMA3-2]
MINKILKSAFLLTLMMPLLTHAQTSIQWQEVNTTSADKINIGYGAFISHQSTRLLISSGITDLTVKQNPFIAEQITDSSIQPEVVYIVDGSNVIATSLSAEQGNRAFAAATDFHGATLVSGGLAKLKATNLVNLIMWHSGSKTLYSYPLPALPNTATSPSSVIMDNVLYVLTGADTNHKFYALDLNGLINTEGKLFDSKSDLDNFTHQNSWKILPSLPLASPKKSYQNGIKLAVQNDGAGEKIFAIGGYQLPLNKLDSAGRIYSKEAVLALTGHWKFDPKDTINANQWQSIGTVTLANQKLNQRINNLSSFGQSHILAFTEQGNTLSFNAITNSWTDYLTSNTDDIQINENTKTAQYISENITSSNGVIYSLNRGTDNTSSLRLWQASLKQPEKNFGWINMTVLVVYLICVVLLGLFFVFKNRNTDDYFRGGQSIPWWAAACSIYATMLSSLTYVALPAVVYQSNWVLLIGIWMIVAVAPLAIYVAMPFFRQIDATSAYEYLSKRFNMSVRLFASSLFTLFHVGRMGIVMALTALSLSAVTPLSASDSVLIMGGLCLIYCTMGGIEAVIWTDTLQTFVLILGAIACFVIIVAGLDGGLTEFISIGLRDDKFTMVNVDFSLDSITTLSIWVIVIGGIGQNLSSYTADQAVVQRYMVTKNPSDARKSIWANAVIAAPSALLFFCIGTALYAFYQTHPEKLDPSIQIDQIFPTFIATELPIGVAGLIVAGIFAAAQSTVSTSMNSIATTLVTDFIRPFNLVNTEKGYMNAARWLTFIMGILGTLAGLIFIDPEIRSLMEAYFKVIGMFMGALGGLFVLGALTKKANSFGAITGILAGVAAMVSAWQLGWADGYLFATIGIVSCLVVGYIASLLTQTANSANKDLTGLTLYTMRSTSIKSTPVSI